MLARAASLSLVGTAARCVCAAVPATVASVAACRRPAAYAQRATMHTRTAAFSGVGIIAPKESLAIFKPREEIEHRIHHLVFDLFRNKLASHNVYETEGEHGSEPALRVDADVPFKALGLDSLDLVELMVAVEGDFHIELTDEEHANVTNIDDIINKILHHPGAY